MPPIALFMVKMCIAGKAQLYVISSFTLKHWLPSIKQMIFTDIIVFVP